MEKDLKAHQNVLYQAYVATAVKNIEEAEDKKANYTKRLDHESTKLAESTAKTSDMEKTYAITKAEYDRINDEVERTTNVAIHLHSFVVQLLAFLTLY